MKMVSIDNLRPGDIIGKSIFNERAELLLASGYRLDEHMIDLLHRMETQYIFVYDEATKDIVPEDAISDVVRQATINSVDEGVKKVTDNPYLKSFQPEEFQQRLESDPKLQNLIIMPQIRKAINDILEELFANHAKMFAAFPATSSKKSEHEHATDVALLALLLSQVFRYDKKEMRSLGVSALLHDVGKMILPEWRNKPANELTQEQRMLLMDHPTNSMLILRGSEPDAFREQQAIVQHHEMQNGTGYPMGLKGSGRPPVKSPHVDPKTIFRYAEIIAVANRYDNFICGRVDGMMYTPEQAVARIIDESNDYWNWHITQALLKVVQCYPVGATVRVRNNGSGTYVGYSGVIAQVNPEDHSKPVIVLTHNSTGKPIVPQQIDFSRESFMNIELVI